MVRDIQRARADVEWVHEYKKWAEFSILIKADTLGQRKRDLRYLLIEAVFLFYDKRVIQTPWETGHRTEERREQQKYQRLNDLNNHKNKSQTSYPFTVQEDHV